MTEIIARHYRQGNTWLVRIRGSTIEGMEEVDGVEPGPLVLAPALFDIQVNGFAGIDLNSMSLQPDGVQSIAHALAHHGVTRFLPTVTTGSPERMRHDLQAIATAVTLSPDVKQAVAGVHVEGPFLSPREGARGAHPLAWVRSPDESLFASLQEAAGGLIRHVTLAPELPGAPEFIRHRVAEGIVVALGHTTANEEQIQAAIDAGAVLSTHLGNGCEAMLPRHVNPITIQLGHDALCASFIADGHHLPPYVLKSFIRAKGIQRTILTTDCMAAAGAPPGRYHLGDLEVEVGDDRVVRQPGKTNFAGSALTLDDAVANAMEWAGLSLADAVDMASLHPAHLFKLSAEPPCGPGGDIILVETTPRFKIAAVFRAGVCVAADALGLPVSRP